jgi:hypothetical protein
MGACAYSVQEDHCGLFIEDSKQVIHVRGVITPSLVEYWSVLSDSIAAANGIEHYFWNPGLAAGSVFMEFGRS